MAGRTTRWAVALVASAVAAGCAQTPVTPEQAEARALRAANCFRVASVDHWRVVDRRRLVVFGRGEDEAWQLQLFMGCDRLRFAEAIGFRSAGSMRICGDPGEEIVLRGERCAIREVRRLSPVELEILFNPDVHEDLARPPEVP